MKTKCKNRKIWLGVGAFVVVGRDRTRRRRAAGRQRRY